jgi:predicted choloylglycine hydrolase
MQSLDTTTFDLSGSHYQIGYEIGQRSTLFTLPAWWPEPPPLPFAQACAREIAAFHPTLLDELYGHADGQEQDYNHLLRILCRYRLGGRPVSIPEQGGCTSFAWRAPDGHLLVGRNYDFYPVQRIRQRIRLAPNGANATVGMRGSVPCGRYDGVNHAGLFCSLHIVLAERPVDVRPGIPFHLIPRLVLETCGSVREALSLLLDIPHVHSFNYLIADADQCAVVECHSERVRIMYPENNLLAIGNFYQHPDMQPLQRHRRQEYSRDRVDYLRSRVWEQADSWVSVAAALTDHTHNVCGHTGGHTTLWSAIADLTARRIAYTTGAPCEVPHTAVAWPVFNAA